MMLQMEKFKLKALTIATLMGGMLGGTGSVMADQHLVDQLSQLKVNYALQDNQAGEHGTNCSALGADWASCNTATITLTNAGQEIKGKDWAIYFHNIRRILKVEMTSLPSLASPVIYTNSHPLT